MDEREPPQASEAEDPNAGSAEPSREAATPGAEARPRPSIRGRGREILTGARLSADEIAQEAEACPPVDAPPPIRAAAPRRARPSLQGMGPRLMVPEDLVGALPLVEAPVPGVTEAEAEATPRAEAGAPAPVPEPVPPMPAPATILPPAAPAVDDAYTPAAAVRALEPAHPEVAEGAVPAGEVSAVDLDEAVPLAEVDVVAPSAAGGFAEPAPSRAYPAIADAEYSPPPAVAALAPAQPELIEVDAVPLGEVGALAAEIAEPAPAVAADAVAPVAAPVTAADYAPPEAVAALTPASPESFGGSHEVEAWPVAEAPSTDLAAEPVPPVVEAAAGLAPVRVAMPEAYTPPLAVAALTPEVPEVAERDAPPPAEVGAPPPVAPGPAPVAPPRTLEPPPVAAYTPAAEVAALMPAGPESLEREAVPLAEAEAAPQAEPLPAWEAFAPTLEPPPALDVVYTPHAAVEALAPAQPESLEAEAAVVEAEAIPLPERRQGPVAPVQPAEVWEAARAPVASPAFVARDATYAAPPPVAALTPAQPEAFARPPALEDAAEGPPLPEPDLDMLLEAAFEGETDLDATPVVPRPMAPAAEVRPEPARSARLLHGAPPPAQPDESVTLTDIRQLMVQISQLQEEIIADVRGERGNSDVYQQELLYADYWLRQSPDYYHSARAVVYRVRAEIARERKVQAWVRRYSRRLFVYLALVAAALVILGLLQGQAHEVGLQIGMSEAVVGAYMPMLFGSLGAVFGALWVLIEQLFIKHDFDPAYIAWYFLTPLIGLLTGVVTYVILYALVLAPAGASGDAGSAAPYLVWALSFLAGMGALLIWGRPRRADDRARPPLDLPERGDREA